VRDGEVQSSGDADEDEDGEIKENPSVTNIQDEFFIGRRVNILCKSNYLGYDLYVCNSQLTLFFCIG